MARAADLTAASRPSRPASVPSPTPALTKGGPPAAAIATAAPAKAPAKAAPGTLVFDATFESGNLVSASLARSSSSRPTVVVTCPSRAEALLHPPMHWYPTILLPPSFKGSVEQLNEFEYDLKIRPDMNNPKYRLWFYFSVKNARAKQTVIFHITNFSKTKSLYREGKLTSTPCMYYCIRCVYVQCYYARVCMAHKGATQRRQ